MAINRGSPTNPGLMESRVTAFQDASAWMFLHINPSNNLRLENSSQRTLMERGVPADRCLSATWGKPNINVGFTPIRQGRAQLRARLESAGVLATVAMVEGVVER